MTDKLEQIKEQIKSLNFKETTKLDNWLKIHIKTTDWSDGQGDKKIDGFK